MRLPYISRIMTKRGHGVHSPFAYSLMREVFMQKNFIGNDTALYDELLRRHISRRSALELQNLFAFSGYSHWGIGIPDKNTEFAVIFDFTGESKYLHSCSDDKITCYIYPKGKKKRYTINEILLSCHDGLSIGNKEYIILFERKGLSKQHIRI